MTHCKRCQSAHTVLAGRVRSKQRYQCKDCSYHFVKGDWRKEKHLDKRKIALHLYLENRGFRAIGRVLNVSNVTVLNWVSTFVHEAKAHHQSQPQSPVAVIELDQMWHFVKKRAEIMDLDCIALDSRRFRMVDFVTGSRSASKGKRLWEKVKGITCARYATDDEEAYKTFLPEHKYRADKAETTNIESGNSNVRHYLARLRFTVQD